MNNTQLFKSIFLITLIAAWSHCSEAATIDGVVTYEGDVPKFREIKMDADPICLSKHGEKVFPQTLELGPNNEMGNVFVYIKEGVEQEEFPPPSNPKIINQEGCMYDPHVMGIMVGQQLKVLNPDGTLHNVHALSKENEEFNLAMPKFRKETTKVFNKPEFMFPIKCDVHPWMSAWVSVMAHPYFAVTKAEDGHYQIDNLPKGKYVLEAWHEKLGSKAIDIEVSTFTNQTINFAFSRP